MSLSFTLRGLQIRLAGYQASRKARARPHKAAVTRQTRKRRPCVSAKVPNRSRRSSPWRAGTRKGMWRRRRRRRRAVGWTPIWTMGLPTNVPPISPSHPIMRRIRIGLADLPSAAAWGKRRAAFYNTDQVLDDHAGLGGEDVEAAELEEQVPRFPASWCPPPSPPCISGSPAPATGGGGGDQLGGPRPPLPRRGRGGGRRGAGVQGGRPVLPGPPPVPGARAPGHHPGPQGHGQPHSLANSGARTLEGGRIAAGEAGRRAGAGAGSGAERGPPLERPPAALPSTPGGHRQVRPSSPCSPS